MSTINNSGPGAGDSSGAQSQRSHPLDQYSVQPKQDGGEQSPYYKSQMPEISLPKGGGALKGIDEKFSVNAVNGTAGLQVGFPLTPGRSGFTPALGVSYSSGGGNSEFGLGWSMSLPAIQRRTDKQLPQYRDAEESDVFLLAGAEDLVPLYNEDGTLAVETILDNGVLYLVKNYRPRIEGLFARIELVSISGGAHKWWRVTTKDNICTWYGLTAAACVADTSDDSRIYKWLPEMSIDNKGNVQVYEYVAENIVNVPGSVQEKNRINGLAPFTNKYLKKVRYCNVTPYFVTAASPSNPYLISGNSPYAPQMPGADYLMEAVLDYSDHTDNTDGSISYTPDTTGWPCRKDPFSDFHAGFEIRTYRRCRRVLMFHRFRELGDGVNLNPVIVASLDFDYAGDHTSDVLIEADYIRSVTHTGYKQKPGTGMYRKSLPAMTMEYQPTDWNSTVQIVSSDDLTNAPEGLTGPYQWTDLYGEGISGILTEQAGAWYYKSNLGDGHFTAANLVAEKPSLNGLGTVLQWADLDADGRRQVVCHDPVQGYFELDDDQEWQPFRTFGHNVNVDWNSPFTKMLDLDGDGRPDLLVTDDRVWTWYKNEGTGGMTEGGFRASAFDEEKGPRLVLNDPIQSIFLADMNGDGMTDIVRIKNGEVCYWPNMGYGRFGAKVTMKNAPVFAPQDSYNPQYLYLSDVSGTGAADLLYMDSNGTTAWINLAGNGWSNGKTIAATPGADPYSKIAVLDFLGNGTGCIVWSSPLPHNSDAPLRYIDLMGGYKPYLMRSYNNGMGKSVTLNYKSSTKYYLGDKAAGTPWATRLPFPVQCLSEVVTTDIVSETTYTQSYSYHHGYYDHAEREFRGFGRVETTDTDAARFYEHHDRTDPENDLNQFPVLTKTWYHTGAWLKESSLLEKFEQEYYQVNDWGVSPQAANFSWGIHNPSAQEQREAHRALKGSALRQEVYALDGIPPALQRPYSVAATMYAVQLVQPAGNNRYASFFTLQEQALSWSIERTWIDNIKMHDARLQHSITLSVDKYGNVLKSLQIAYPRKGGTTDEVVVNDAQAKNHIVYSTALYTNDVINTGMYRLRLPYEQCSFELYVPPADFPARILTKQDFVNSNNNGWLQAFHGYDFAGQYPLDIVVRRQLSCARIIYKKDDTTTYLPMGELESLALPHKTFSLAFSQTTMETAYEEDAPLVSPVIENYMFDEAGYKQNQDINEFSPGAASNLDSVSDEWRWMFSGTTGYSSVSAYGNFYQADTYTDPWGNSSLVTYWPGYALLPQSTADAIGNTATILSYDWRCLQPTAMQDANYNQSEIIYDALCMPVAMAVKGKGTEADYLLDINSNIFDPHNTSDLSAQNDFWLPVDSTNPSQGPDAQAAQLLGQATWRCIYNLENQPAAVAMIARQEHYTVNNNSDTVVRITYTDGLGRIAMQKARVTDGDVPQLYENWQTSPPPSVSPPDETFSYSNTRWVGSGKTVYNNKGNAVLQYEPYFSNTHTYDKAAQAAFLGISPRMHYDPLGRLFKTEMPDGTYTHTTWDNWTQVVYDANDTVYDTSWEVARRNVSTLGADETDAATKAIAHWRTPTTMHLDTLARPFFTIALTDPFTPIKSYAVLDIQGNKLAVADGLTDSNGNPRLQLQYAYNMLKAPCRQQSIDGGMTVSLLNVAGQPCYSVDAEKNLAHITYDALQRPLKHELMTPDGSGGWTTPVALSVISYGETATPAGGSIEDHNLRGKVASTLDGSGMNRVDSYDFKGLPVLTNLQLLQDKTLHDADWNSLSSGSDLDTEIFTTTAVIDALGRMITATDAGGNITRHSYDKGGALNGVYVTLNGSSTETTYVQDIHYNAKGQREAIWYGNGTKTSYTYDPLTYRLRRLLTVNLNTNDKLQDLNYWYDPVGNITRIKDAALDTVYFDNSVVKPVSDYTYDALYRLIIAQGREQKGMDSYKDGDNTNDSANIVSSTNPSDTQNYTQYYSYDAVGNILQLQHQARSGSYTRQFSYDSDSNQLRSANVDINTGSGYNYSYDARGNMTAMPHLSTMKWDHSNQLRYISDGTVGTDYQYSSGQRVRKYTDKGSGYNKEERIYLGNYEIYRKFDSNSSLILERTTVHVSDDSGRIAMVETRTQSQPCYGIDCDESPQQLSRYIYSNHLGSATLELDENGEAISYEEYHPYGTTAYQEMSATIKAAAKRYRYTGKERDEESGLYYHGARYYAPWLCRWTAVDPLEGKYAGWSAYQYVKCNPVMDTDSSGMGGDNDWRAPMAAPAQANYATMAGYGQAGFANGRGSVLNPFTVSDTTVVAKRKPNVVDNVGHAAWITPAMVDADRATRMYQNQDVVVSDMYGGGNIGPRQQMQWKVNSIATAHSEEVGDQMASSFIGSQAYAISGGDERWLKLGSVADAGLMFASGKTGAPYGKTEPLGPVREPYVPTTEGTLNNQRSIPTSPSGFPDANATPGGKPSPTNSNMDIETRTSIDRENEAADILAKNGFDIEQNPSVNNTSRNPDYIIEGNVFDCYSPYNSNKSVRGIWSEVLGKVEKGQTDRVFLNLKNWGGDLNALQRQFNSYPIEGLQEVIILDANNKLIFLTPPTWQYHMFFM